MNCSGVICGGMLVFRPAPRNTCTPGGRPVADQFDPKLHRVIEARRFADLRVGEMFRNPSRTMTEAYFAAFQAISGDNHPIHYDREYCRDRGYPNLLAHGFQVLAFTAVGAGSFPHTIADSLMGF